MHAPSVREIKNAASISKKLINESDMSTDLYLYFLSEVDAHILSRLGHSIQICDLRKLLEIYPQNLWISYVH